MDKIVDAHYFTLPTQGNVYSLAILNLCSGANKFIVASCKKKIFSFEYCEDLVGALKPTVKEISCTYIPSGAEIISVDTFNKSNTCDDFQIGIAIAKLNAEGGPETYLNIYSEQDLENNFILNIDSIAQNCLMIELNFIPYHLTHSYLIENSDMYISKETVWLLSGSDCKIHVFQEDAQNHTYTEVDTAELFPELSNPPSIVLWLHIKYTHNFTRRVSVMGCECGTVQLTVFNNKTNTTVSSHTEVFDGPISQVLLFSFCPGDFEPPQCFQNKDAAEGKSCHNSSNDLNLLVCNTLEASVVYMKVEEGLSNKYCLEGSEMFDACLCSCVADINMDGVNEILLGTYGQMILVYRLGEGGLELSGKRTMANPVHALHYVDLIGDGVNELVVQTLSGVHIMQHDPEEIHKIFLSRLKKLLGKEEEDDEKSIGEEKPESLPEPEECPCQEACEQPPLD